MTITIIGAGAAGCFAAIDIKRRCPQADVIVLEGGSRPLAKVAITGGGRCNITNTFEDVKSAEAVYPRGARLMKRLLKEFGPEDTMRWFENEGVRLVRQEDHCVFPASQDAMEIVNTLLQLMNRHGARLLTGHRVSRIEREETGGSDSRFVLHFATGSTKPLTADMVLVATGGFQKASSLSMLAPLGVKTVAPVPSLFSLCLPGDNITQLTGTVVERTTASLAGTKLKASGPLLITHWGMSGPAILKLSAFAARLLHDDGYKATLAINWMGGRNEQEVMETVAALAAANPRKQLASAYPTELNSRLWLHLLAKSGLKADTRWGEMGRKGMNRLVSTLANDHYRADGKNRFKEEFVTCGGVDLSEISPATMESKTCPGLFFAGEAVDVDGITGGFNLQAAWTMAHVAAKGMALRWGLRN